MGANGNGGIRMIRETTSALWLGFSILLTASAPACARRQAEAPAREIPREVDNLDARVGWYRMPAGDTVHLTFSARGGLRLFSLGDSLYWTTLIPSTEGELRWTDSLGPLVEWASEAGSVSEFRWTSATGDSHRAERLRDHGYRVQEISITSGTTVLSGSLFLPELTDRSVPAAVMIHGSGESDRDNAWYMMIADALVRNGIAVLLPDKRGSGKSEGNWFTTDLSGFAADAAAAMNVLRSHPAVDPDRAGFIGLSQGGHIAPMAARLSPAAFIINISGSAVPLDEQIVHEVEQDMKRDRLPGFLNPIVRAVSLRIIKKRRPDWWNTNGPIDPIDHWRDVDVPVVVAYGEDDELDNVPVIRSVERLRALGRENIDIWVFTNSGHGLWEPDTLNSVLPGGRRRVRGDFLNRMVQWVHQEVR